MNRAIKERVTATQAGPPADHRSTRGVEPVASGLASEAAKGLTIGSVCSGVGGIDLGLEWAGLGPTLWQIEIDAYCRNVLEKHWPHAVRSIADLRDATASRLPRVDLICGGTPCQNLSSAGDRSGLGGPKSRLFYEFARLVGEMRPAWVVFENVASGAARWVDAVSCELGQLGYATLPIQVAAGDLGAWHRRARVFILAHRDGSELRAERGRPESGPGEAELGDDGAKRDAADADDEPRSVFASTWGDLPGLAADHPGFASGRVARSQREESLSDAVQSGREGPGPGAHEGRARPSEDPWWPSLADVVPVLHGVSGGLAGRRRRAALRALGNACTPQQAQVVGEVIRILLDASAKGAA